MEDKKVSVAEIKQKACEGDAKAQAQLGMLYLHGKGVTQNHRESYIWSSLAVANGIEDAAKYQRIASRQLTATALGRAQDDAAKRMEAIEAKQKKK